MLPIRNPCEPQNHRLQSYNKKRMRPLLALVLSCSLFAATDLSNRRAPGFSLSDQRQVEHDLQDYRGKILIIEWMQTTCPHCAHFATVLEEVKNKYKGKVEVVSIVLPPDSIDPVKKFIATNKTTYPILFDSGQMSASYLKITPQNPTVVFPQILIVDGAGTIKENYKYSNETANFFSNSKELSAVLDKMVK